VPTGQSRDDATLQEGLSRWVASQPDLVPGVTSPSGTLRLKSLERAEGGMANETLLLELNGDNAGVGVVVRLPPLEATFLGYDLAPQAAVQNAVAACGVPAPAPAAVVDDRQWIGTPFLVMPRVNGRIPGPAPLFDEWLTTLDRHDQERVHDGLIDTLAAVHAVDWRAAGLDAVLPLRSLAETVDYWTEYVEWAGDGEPLPSLVTALEWCGRTLPSVSETAPVLQWGDARLGNLVYDDHLDVHAVLDWDLASLGPREMDLGWFFGLEFMMEQLFKNRLGGFPSREEGLARYEEKSGYRALDLHWHEVFALARALAINDRHQRIAGRHRRRENPMGDILMAQLAAAEGV
jgi:aminoglycoside phosphotransferase (APT) family kinase protein